jgi:NAD(P)-dependent dehydrogenase (short-subunit alcohol dehydrogenase family)
VSATVSLAGRGAVVTGGGRGIGAAIAAALAEAGAQVVVAARSAAEIEGVATALRARGAKAWPVVCDVSDEASVDALAAGARELLDAVSIDILVNAAGDGGAGRSNASRPPPGGRCSTRTPPARTCAHARSCPRCASADSAGS